MSNEKKTYNISDVPSRILKTLIFPSILLFFYYYNLVLFDTVKISLIFYFIIIFVLPFTFKYNPKFQRYTVFLNSVNLPLFARFKNPERHGLHGTRNFYIETEDKVSLGVWHILPENLVKNSLAKEDEDKYYEKTLNRGPPVFLYMHGSISNRADGHHIHKVLRKYYHVITFDYRGYGDSTGVPHTELDVIRDAIAIYKWVKNVTPVNIFVWGHSLGCSISTHALRLLAQENIYPKGLVLESPFDNMRNEVSEHPMTLAFRYLPWFTTTIVDPIYNSGFLFASDEHIKHVDCPIMMLHAEDDVVVPFKLGLRLYYEAQKHRTNTQGPIKFNKFPKNLRYGHRFICHAPELPTLINTFVSDCLNNTTTEI